MRYGLYRRNDNENITVFSHHRLIYQITFLIFAQEGFLLLQIVFCTTDVLGMTILPNIGYKLMLKFYGAHVKDLSFQK